MNYSYAFLRSLAVLSVLSSAGVQAQTASCANCAATISLPSSPITVSGGAAYSASGASAVSAGTDTYISGAVISGSSGSLPNGIAGIWCGDWASTPFTTPLTYTAYSSYGTLPAGSQNANWPKVNWVLNNKQGTVSDVQAAIWMLLTGDADGFNTTTAAYQSLLAGANANPTFTPAAGQVMAVVLYADGIAPGGGRGSTARQDLIAEVRVPNCGTLGDFVWSDTNRNGVQDAGEQGIDGVTLRLLDAGGALLSTTTTAPNMGQSGYYQFRNLACGVPYQVQVDISGAPLAGKTLSPLNGTANTALDSNPNPAPVTIPPSGSDQTIDFGFYTPCTGAIGNFVWNDKNMNGIQDSGEMGIGGVRVLLAGPGGLAMNQLTAGDGSYRFAGLCDGSYTITVDTTTLPANFTASPTNAPGSTTVNDSNGSPTTVILPTISSTDDTVDFGYYLQCNSSIGDRVWSDLNGNGIQDGGEPGLNGVTLELRDSGGNLLKTTTTMQLAGVNGSYVFGGLCNGTYQVVVNTGVPGGYTASPTNAPGSTPANDSNGSGTTVVLPLNTNDTTVDFGYVPPCTGVIGDFVWLDTNGNGVQDGGELPLSGVVLNLRRISDNSLLRTTTSTTGPGPNYQFSGVCTGDYYVEAVRPTGYVASPTGAGTTATDSNPNPASVSLATNASSDLTVDFGFYPVPNATCQDINGYQGTAITPVQILATGGVPQYAFSATGLPSAITISGTGLISGVPASTTNSTYTVTVTDSRNNIATATCNIRINAPVSASCVSITAYLGVPITPVQLTASGGTGTGYTFSATGLPSGLTMSTGGLISGTPGVGGTFPYTVTIRDSAGNVGTLNCSVTVNIPGDPVCSGSIGNFVWYDVNGNGIQDSGEPGIAGVVLTLSNGMTARTDANGFYSFSGLCPATYTVTAATPVGSTPTRSLQGTDRALDSNGSPTTVTLTALSPNDTAVDFGFVQGNVCSLTQGYWKNHPEAWDVQTLVLGNQTYSATELMAILKAPVKGDASLDLAHQLIAAKLNLANGVNAGTANGAVNQGDLLLIQAASSPSARLATGSTVTGFGVGASSTLGAQMTATASALDDFNSDGKLQPGCSASGTTPCTAVIGDLVWLDANKNGIQDASEAGIAGVTVRLRDAVTNALIATTVTDSKGKYSFTALCGGKYNVEIDVPAGYLLTTVSAAGSTAANDSNSNPTTVTLVANSGSDLTVDFGLQQTTVACTGSIGNFVWNDLNGNGIQDSGEPGIAGVVVSLRGSNGVTMSFTTQADGLYQFSNLCAATYTITASTPSGFNASTTKAGNNTAVDSNPNPETVTLATASTSDQTIDFGFRSSTGNTGNACGLTIGYWKNHLSAWPVSTLVLGSQSYTKTELTNILGMPVKGDASISMGQQLIAAKLNVANGTDINTAAGAITNADNILKLYAGKIPLGVAASSSAGATMVSIGSALDDFNSDGQLQPGCVFVTK